MQSAIDVVGVPERHSAASWRRAATIAAAIVFVPVATAAQLWRVSGEPVWNTVWGEDATVFYRDALDLPLTETFDKPYNGYAHALPRILAAVGTRLPPEWYSAWAAVSWALVVSLLALFVYFASAPLLRAPLRQGILAGSLLVLPVLPLEVLAALCNLQWILPIACLFAVLFPVKGWTGIAVRAVIVLIAPLTSPLCLLLAPFALYQAAVFIQQRDGWRRLVVPTLFLEACAIQFIVYLGAEHRPLGGAVQPPLGEALDDIADLYMMVVLYGGLDTGLSSELWRSSSSWVGWVAVAAVAVLLLVKLRRAELAARWWISGFAAASAAVFAFTMVQRSERLAYALAHPPYDLRYWIVPQLLLLAAFLVPPVVDSGLLVGRPSRAPAVSRDRTGRFGPTWHTLTGGLPWMALSVLTVAWLAVAVVPSYRQEVSRSTRPSWPDQVAEAQAACRVDPTATQIVEVDAPEWRLLMTCEQLDAGGR